jgi:hypothetical protein
MEPEAERYLLLRTEQGDGLGERKDDGRGIVVAKYVGGCVVSAVYIGWCLLGGISKEGQGEIGRLTRSIGYCGYRVNFRGRGYRRHCRCGTATR